MGCLMSLSTILIWIKSGLDVQAIIRTSGVEMLAHGVGVFYFKERIRVFKGDVGM